MLCFVKATAALHVPVPIPLHSGISSIFVIHSLYISLHCTTPILVFLIVANIFIAYILNNQQNNAFHSFVIARSLGSQFKLRYASNIGASTLYLIAGQLIFSLLCFVITTCHFFSTPLHYVMLNVDW